MAKKKILIIDDEAGFGRMVKLNLEQTGNYEVRTETDSARGVAAAKEFRPDLILLDIGMPGTSGDQVADEILHNSNLASVPIVFLTAIVKKDEVVAQDGVIGGRPFIAKPVTTQALIARIEEVLRGK